MEKCRTHEKVALFSCDDYVELIFLSLIGDDRIIILLQYACVMHAVVYFFLLRVFRATLAQGVTSRDVASLELGFRQTKNCFLRRSKVAIAGKALRVGGCNRR